jgi:hypothetical protein
VRQKKNVDLKSKAGENLPSSPFYEIMDLTKTSILPLPSIHLTSYGAQHNDPDQVIHIQSESRLSNRHFDITIRNL